MHFRPVYSKLALMPLARNEGDSLDKHEHWLQSQLLWSERKQIADEKYPLQQISHQFCLITADNYRNSAAERKGFKGDVLCSVWGWSF